MGTIRGMGGAEAGWGPHAMTSMGGQNVELCAARSLAQIQSQALQHSCKQNQGGTTYLANFARCSGALREALPSEEGHNCADKRLLHAMHIGTLRVFCIRTHPLTQ